MAQSGTCEAPSTLICGDWRRGHGVERPAGLFRVRRSLPAVCPQRPERRPFAGFVHAWIVLHARHRYL